MAETAGATGLTRKVEQADIATTEALKPVFESAPAKAIGKLGKLGDEPPLVALSTIVAAAGVITFNRRLASAGVRMLAAHGLATGLKTLVKNRIDRTRPMLLDRGEYRMEAGTSHAKELRSFPSGHAAGIAAVVRAASREYRLGPGGAVAAAGFAGLQIVRRVHFPSDVLAGAAVGLVAEAVANRLLRPLLGAPPRG